MCTKFLCFSVIPRILRALWKTSLAKTKRIEFSALALRFIKKKAAGSWNQFIRIAWKLS